jgi:hypothetical protein
MVRLLIALMLPMISLALTVDIIKNKKENIIRRAGREVPKVLDAMSPHMEKMEGIMNHPILIGSSAIILVVVVAIPSIIGSSNLLLLASTNLIQLIQPLAADLSASFKSLY